MRCLLLFLASFLSLSLLVSCGSTSGVSAPVPTSVPAATEPTTASDIQPSPAAVGTVPAPTELTGGIRPTPDPQAGENPPETAPAAAERQAECAFPVRMQVNQPAVVRFSLFTPGNQPNPLPGTNLGNDSLSLPTQPGLETWVSVTLLVNGKAADQQPNQQQQRLSDRSNIWIWQVTTTAEAPVVLQPMIDLEYRTANGQIVQRFANVWTENYTVTEVVGDGYLKVGLAWLGDSLKELLTGALGTFFVSYVVKPTRKALVDRQKKANHPQADPPAPPPTAN